MISLKLYPWQSALYLVYETWIDFNFTTKIAKTKIMQYSAPWFDCFISFSMFFTSWHRLGRSYMILWMFFHVSKAQHLYLLPLYYSHLQSYPSFWPENTRSKKYGQVFTVEHMSHNHFKNIRCWTFRINKKVYLKNAVSPFSLNS